MSDEKAREQERERGREGEGERRRRGGEGEGEESIEGDGHTGGQSIFLQANVWEEVEQSLSHKSFVI